MKNLLIIAEPRCGSSNLLYAISTAYGYTAQYERDSNTIKKDLKIVNNTVAKIQIGHRTLDVNYYKDLVSKFDKTILLARRDYKKQCQALWALFNINDNQWHQKWHVKDLPDNIEELDSWVYVDTLLRQWKDLQIKLSKETGIDIEYYEDVYSNKSLNDKSIKLNLKYFGKEYKLRHEDSETII